MTDLRLDADVRIEESPVGPVVRPGGAGRPGETVVLHLTGDGAPDPVPGLALGLAGQTGATVVCARYRAAFPAALDDVSDGYRYGQAMGPVAVVGEGLGAELAAALLVRLRDTGASLPRCAVLVSALLDLTLQAPSLLLNAACDPGFDAARLRGYVTRYAAGTPLTDPVLSPLYANLHGLPPIQLLAAGTDPLLDDSLAFAARAARSGVTVDMQVRPDAASLHPGTIPAVAAFLATWVA